MHDIDPPDDDRQDRADRLKWELLSVLFSSQPLSPSVARVLFDAAWELYRTDQGAAPINAPLMYVKYGLIQTYSAQYEVAYKSHFTVVRMAHPQYVAYLMTNRDQANSLSTDRLITKWQNLSAIPLSSCATWSSVSIRRLDNFLR